MIIDIVCLIWLHFIADFILQTRKIATNKSKCNKDLFYHCLLYGIPFLWFGLKFVVINCVIHFIIDYITSRITTKLYLKNKNYLFFTIIGLDQSIHITTLLLTYNMICRGG